MRASRTWVPMCWLASATPLLNIEASMAQERSAEDRACIIAAVERLPRVDALRVEGSRILYQGRAE